MPRSHTARSREETRTHRRAQVLARPSRGTALLVVLALACSSAGTSRRGNPAFAKPKPRPGEVASYRLPLRDNPVDAGEAFRCYGHCQEQQSPKEYLACLSACPGFAVTPGEACDEHDVPPVAACLTVRKIPNTEQLDTGLVVVGVIGSFLLVVGAASLCAASHSQCGYGYYPPPH